VLVREVRAALDELLERKIAEPEFNIQGSELISAISGLITADGQA
jgi:hypothetical protein